MQSSGYEVARRAVPTHLCATLRRAALAAAREQQRDAVSWRTALRKLLPRRLGSSGTDAATTPRPVRAPKHRVHVQLPLCADTKALLSAALSPTTGLGDAASRCGLTPSAKLVELSVMIALPGAEAQAPHTDVPPHTPQRMATLWIALQDVNRSLGPTMIYPAAPDELANRIDWAAVQERAVPVQPAITTYGPDGSPDEIPLGLVSPASDNRSCDLPSSVAELGLGSAVAVEMSQGDAMLMDVRTFHYGGANRSAPACSSNGGATDCSADASQCDSSADDTGYIDGCRLQLSATFEELPVATGDADDKPDGSMPVAGSMPGPISSSTSDAGHGFTYELRADLAEKFRLGDFLPPIN